MHGGKRKRIPFRHCYTALGHKLRFFKDWRAQFMTVGII